MIVLPVEKIIDWKRPPLILMGLIVINVLVFAFYQSGDSAIMEKAVQVYEERQLDQTELPAYIEYQREIDPSERVNTNDPWLSWHMLMDDDFRVFIKKKQAQFISSKNEVKWQKDLDEVNDILGDISSSNLGLNTDKISLTTLLSHQFLHGDIMHLFGNMVFLLLTGFAVESALGHARFLSYYLLSGIGAGLLFALTHSLSGGSNISLVGASGSISGVMAMYLALFKLKKIEFFYWFFIFTGYFRAAAIILLPAYILKELFFLLMTDGSNIAYTAHIGGFLTGAILIIITQKLINDAIDHDYLNNQEEVKDPYLINLNKLYQEIGRCNFSPAWSQLQKIKKTFPNNQELDNIEFNLLYALDRNKASDFLLRQLKLPVTTPHLAKAVVKYWQKSSEEAKEKLSFVENAALLRNTLLVDQPELAEQIFSKIHSNTTEYLDTDLATLSRKIELYYQETGRNSLSTKYAKITKEIIGQANKVPAS